MSKEKKFEQIFNKLRTTDPPITLTFQPSQLSQDNLVNMIDNRSVMVNGTSNTKAKRTCTSTLIFIIFLLITSITANIVLGHRLSIKPEKEELSPAERKKITQDLEQQYWSRQQSKSDNATMGICAVCWDNERDTVFSPCGHMICEGCADHYNYHGPANYGPCHICRTTIQKKIKLFP